MQPCLISGVERAPGGAATLEPIRTRSGDAGQSAEAYDAPSFGTVVSCSILASCSLPLTVVSLPSLE